jgi:tetratricopeptide (TPR) repeat protein
VAAESIDVAGSDPAEAVRLAELALRIAELCPGEEAWRYRLMGYAFIHLANARRVAGNLRGAREAMAAGKRLWAAGAAADPGLLDEARVLWLEATLQSADRRFDLALKAIDEAFRVDRAEMAARLLYAKARALEGLGDFPGSTVALEQAASLVDSKQEPRVSLGIRFQLLVNLCLEDRAAEAELRLQDVRVTAERRGNELDLVRVLWLEGMVAAGLGRQAEAEAAYDQVRRELASREIAYDCALVTLDLAVLLLAGNRTEEVRSLAAGLLWIFRSQQVPENALAALRLFAEAAGRDAASATLAREVRLFLYRAQRDPELRFHDKTGAE